MAGNLISRAIYEFQVSYEQTIRAEVSCTGVGLHSGAPVSMRILPAPAGAGILFRRVDLDNFVVEAVSRNVARVSYATSLMKKGVLISTTEHLLSAFIGMGIDNAIVELDNLELPILDGSALPIVEMIFKRVSVASVVSVLICGSFVPSKFAEGDKFIAVYPGDYVLGFLQHQLPSSAHRGARLSKSN